MLELKNANSVASVAQSQEKLIQVSTLSSADATQLTKLTQSTKAGNTDTEEGLGASAASIYEVASAKLKDTLRN